MQLQYPLGVISSSLDTVVLTGLALADDWFSHKQITEALSGASRKGVYNALTRLATVGIVDTLTRGNTHLVRLNREHLAAPYIIALANLRTEFIERLKAEAGDWPEPPVYAALFGSGARGEMRLDSDIDLFFLRPEDAGEGWDDQVFELASRASRWTGNDVRPLIFSSEELRNAAVHESVIQSVADEGIPFVGNRLKFRRLVGAR